MKRAAPLQRTSTVKARRTTPRRSERVRDPVYLAWLHTRPCEVWGVEEGACWVARALLSIACEGPIEADHVGRRPFGRKCSDREAISLCRRHHADRHALRGFWATKSAQARRRWLDDAIARTQADYAAREPCLLADEVIG